MQLPALDYALWTAASLLIVIVCALAFRRRLYLQLPFFTTYLALLVARDLTTWGVYLVWGYGSPFAFYYVWLTQAIVLASRAMAIGEIAWRALRQYRGIWALGWRLLCGIALLLLSHAALSARYNTFRINAFLVTAERDLELAAAGTLVAVLAICRYYRIRLEPVHRMVALGLGFYSAIQVLNDNVLRLWGTPYFHLWNGIRMVAFGVALVIWLLALRKPLPTAAEAPILLPQHIYDGVAPQVNYRLRLLNQRILEILKS